MRPSWSAVTKRGVSQAASPPTRPPENTQLPAAKGECASLPQSAPPPRSVTIGSVGIAIELNHDNTQIPYSVPRDPEFWKAQYKEYRRRRAAEQCGEAAVATSTDRPAPAPAKVKPSSWAALLRSSSSSATSSGTVKMVGSQPAAANGIRTVDMRKFTTLEDVLENWRIVFSAPAVQPRGLVNSGNMCFMNVVLQALLYCAPFYSMLRSIKENVVFSFSTSTPLLEALIQFVHEFKQDATPLAQLGTGLDEPFVPENVYEALRKKNVFQTLRGQQEDAQEFMSYLVDGIHEEMALVLQAHRAKAGAAGAEPTGNSSGGDDGWMEVGPNNRAVHMRDAHEVRARTPITQIFGGTLQSLLTVPGPAGRAAPARANREPFQWLALDVSSDDVETVEDALDALAAPESIEGYMNVQGEAVAATKQIALERVPPVLVLHLKRFVFCADEGVQKVHKFIAYPEELTLAPAWLARTREAARHRDARYRLSGVIYHHGSHASGGHYTCDVRRPSGEWVQFDDIDIGSLESVDAVLDEKPDRTAYILFYTTC
ncbi:hypothetical protein H4S02_008196 [Coemansia sp. RSA 2611]|nr:hypothetical protein H4S02_008196 [Coemansia sp. RSA 2611]